MSKPWICGRQKQPLYCYAIQHPEGYLWPIHECPDEIWRQFFSQNPHRLPLEHAIRAYEAIGYRRLKFGLLEEVE